MKRAILRIGHLIFNVEIADSFLSRIKGLSFRKTLSRSEGLLFVFSKPGKYKFWMFGMKFPIDIAFISENKKVVDKITLELGDEYTASKEFKYALEVKKGLLKDISIGDDVEWISMN